MSKLALFGGSPSIKHKFNPWNTLDEREAQACNRVIKSGVLSGFVGAWVDAFEGGPEVRQFEKNWASFFKTKHAISVNSATSGLYAAMGAIGLNPGDEVIVPPLTMSATATAPLIYGGIPVFADIDPVSFTLDIKSVKTKLSSRTKAVLAVNLFGHPAHLDELKTLCLENKISLIEDNAQAPGARINHKFTGTIGDIGVFSLNCHKHIQTGEGGILTTDSDELASRLKLIRNHAEAVVAGKNERNLVNMVGWNYRMTELEAAVGNVQLEKLPDILSKKRSQAHRLHKLLDDLKGLTLPIEAKSVESVYYTYALKINAAELGITKARLCEALSAEGVPVVSSYVKPLYLAPLFAKKVAFGFEGYPFNLQPDRHYRMGDCPQAEKIQAYELFYIPWCSFSFSDEDIDLISQGFHKVWSSLNELKK